MSLFNFYKNPNLTKASLDNFEHFLDTEFMLILKESKLNQHYQKKVIEAFHWNLTSVAQSEIKDWCHRHDNDCTLYAWHEYDFYSLLADILIPVNHKHYWCKKGLNSKDFARQKYELRGFLEALIMRGYEKKYFTIPEVNYYIMAEEFCFHQTLTPTKRRYWNLPWLPDNIPEEFKD